MAPPAPPVVVAMPSALTAAKPETPFATTGARELDCELVLLDNLELEETDKVELRELEPIVDRLELGELELIVDRLELRKLELIEDEIELEREDELNETELVDVGVAGREHSLTPPPVRPPNVASEQTKLPVMVL